MLEAAIAFCFFVFFVLMTIWVVMDYNNNNKGE
jgi:hypothetical protein